MTTSIFGTSNSSGGTASTAVAASDTSDMFTKLLVAQIQNQDPLSPTDPSQFVNQLATLSQTEALSNVSTLTSANNSVLQSLQVLALGAQVGSNVMVNTPTVNLGSETVTGSIALSAASSTTQLVLTGSNGVKHNIDLGTQGVGTVPLSIDPAALGLPAGSYKMSVVTSSGEAPTVDISGKLGSVRLSATGSIVLNVSTVGEVSPAAITGFNGVSASSAMAAN